MLYDLYMVLVYYLNSYLIYMFGWQMGQGGILTQLFLDDIIFEQLQNFYELDYEKHPKQNQHVC